ncbi:UNVERIFIED_CONTAM: hypothetical protein PYX00_006209 [Menopon gallinae]|uniref:Uncharacterized protein n=1 Tax=Menopon gallinae TaxID=328185 RepID=A0AAW2HUF1_9NEOP
MVQGGEGVSRDQTGNPRFLQEIAEDRAKWKALVASDAADYIVCMYVCMVCVYMYTCI